MCLEAVDLRSMRTPAGGLRHLHREVRLTGESWAPAGGRAPEEKALVQRP